MSPVRTSASTRRFSAGRERMMLSVKARYHSIWGRVKPPRTVAPCPAKVACHSCRKTNRIMARKTPRRAHSPM